MLIVICYTYKERKKTCFDHLTSYTKGNITKTVTCFDHLTSYTKGNITKTVTCFDHLTSYTKGNITKTVTCFRKPVTAEERLPHAQCDFWQVVKVNDSFAYRLGRNIVSQIISETFCVIYVICNI